MMNKYSPYLLTLGTLLWCLGVCGQTNLRKDFNSPNEKILTEGRGDVKIKNRVLSVKNAWAVFGQNDWKDYEFSVRARTPKNQDQVQIWCGFRSANRDDRYILGLRGGIQNDLYLARLGYMGTDDHLALRHLDFKLRPGDWYTIKVRVKGDRIVVFLNDEQLPRINITDTYTQFSPSGKIILGGSWITTEFDDLKVFGITGGQQDHFANQDEYNASSPDKESKRKIERRAYKPRQITRLSADRQNISLNGNWLFKPGYEINNEKEALTAGNDEDWHVMNVPDFWNPNREWLHGERYNSASKGVSDNFFQKESERCQAYTFDYKKTKIGYYRQWLEMPSNLKNKNYELCFDAVSKVADIYVNGKKMFRHIGMFGEFKVNITDVIKPGKNLIVVKVTRDYVTDIKDADKVTDVSVTVPITNKMLKDLAHGFYNEDPAGIWQPVSLVISDRTRIDEVFIKPSLHGASFDVTVKNNSAEPKKISLVTLIKEGNAAINLYKDTSLKNVILKEWEQRKFTFDIHALNPKLWTPATPNLYQFTFSVIEKNKKIDEKIISSGFRTFEVKGDYLYLNGIKYWLRGGDHTPMSLAPNDSLLANRFSELMHLGNIAVTRTHTAPYDEIWMAASDKQGVGVSYEGQWPWLMIKESMPDQKLIELWKQEYFDLMKKYRNHPSLLMWTVNNEMKFYDNDPDIERAKLKMKIISDVVKEMRRIDPTRPIVFDSNYTRDERKFGKDFFENIDDGDIDDHHWYIDWYHGSIFSEFNGEWQKNHKNKGRPLISQEFSTGYPSETGHPTRFYTYVHQNPSSLVGKYAYEYNDPKYFLEAQSFITRESAEAIRRTNGEAAGIMHFAALTWFQNVYKAEKIHPHVTYDLMKKALQPVLVSAELWGRHFYSGEKLPTRIYIVNDSEKGKDLEDLRLEWSIIRADGKIVTSGRKVVGAVPYYGRKYIEPEIFIPEIKGIQRIDGALKIQLFQKDKSISANEYKILITSKSWLDVESLKKKKIILVDRNHDIKPVFDYVGLNVETATDLSDALKQHPDLLIVSSLLNQANDNSILSLQKFLHVGGKVLLLNSGEVACKLFPKEIRGLIKESGEIMTMEIPESPIYEGIEPMDTRYFNNERRENPLVCTASYQVEKTETLERLAVFTKVHGYLNGDMLERKETLDGWRGYPLVKITEGNGQAILSEVLLNKGKSDPIAGKLLINMIKDLTVK